MGDPMEMPQKTILKETYLAKECALLAYRETFIAN
jgi:hypothetical protein